MRHGTQAVEHASVTLHHAGQHTLAVVCSRDQAFRFCLPTPVYGNHQHATPLQMQAGHWKVVHCPSLVIDVKYTLLSEGTQLTQLEHQQAKHEPSKVINGCALPCVSSSDVCRLCTD